MMKMHMRSYAAETNEEHLSETDYPALCFTRDTITPLDSPQDKPSSKRKRSLQLLARKDYDEHLLTIVDDSNVRKFHKKF